VGLGVCAGQLGHDGGAAGSLTCGLSSGAQYVWSHARKTVAVTVGPDTIQVPVETSITVTAARTTSHDIRRHKASNYG